MHLPGLENAVIEPRKLRDYLLSRSHPAGRTKAEFFARLGYNREAWHMLASDLRSLAEMHTAEEAGRTEYGTKYRVRGRLTGPAGRGEIVCVWIILMDEDFPRFVTAYPE